jgi:hypothetical protein
MIDREKLRRDLQIAIAQDRVVSVLWQGMEYVGLVERLDETAVYLVRPAHMGHRELRWPLTIDLVTDWYVWLTPKGEFFAEETEE